MTSPRQARSIQLFVWLIRMGKARISHTHRRCTCAQGKSRCMPGSVWHAKPSCPQGRFVGRSFRSSGARWFSSHAHDCTGCRGALCCDATLVLPVSLDGQPQEHSEDEDGAARSFPFPSQNVPGAAAHRSPVPRRTRIISAGPQGQGALALVRLRRLRAHPLSIALRNAAATTWSRRCWAQLSVAAANRPRPAGVAGSRSCP